MRWLCALVLAIPGAAGGGAPEIWAGHQVVHGEVQLPLLGKVPTRTDSFLLARVVRTEGGYRIEQTACRVEMAPVLGSQARLAPGAVRKLPATVFSLVGEGGQLVGAPWTSGWGEEDVEGDGRPGLTVKVDAPLCGGELYVASDTRSVARASEREGGLRGELKVRSVQRVLGTSGGCLSVFAGDSREELRGSFAYAPVPAGATCESLLASWPVRAAE